MTTMQRPEADSSHLLGLLAGKVAIVTGASRGIGAETARAFAAAGATVALAARDRAALTDLADELRASGTQSLAVPTDVGDPAAMEALVKRVLETYGRLDVAFNNAGGGHMPAPLADISVEDFDRAVSVNARGVFLSMKYELSAMLTGGGAIVNMASTAGVSGVRGMSAYVAAKHAIVGLSRSAALDYAEWGIRVNVVAPGPILTDRIHALREEQRRPIVQAVPMRRLGQPGEVGATVAWLCSDEASFITGATIPVDGGRLAGGG